MQYSAGLVNWTKEELYKLDVGTRKLMCLHHIFSTNSSDNDRLYVPRSQGGRGLCSVADVTKGEFVKVLGNTWRNHQSHCYRQSM